VSKLSIIRTVETFSISNYLSYLILSWAPHSIHLDTELTIVEGQGMRLHFGIERGPCGSIRIA
jgi:hypothetical protein